MSNLEKKSYSSEEIRNFVESWQQSGMSKKQFSDQHGLKYYTFIAWCDKYGKAEKSAGFKQVTLASPGERVFAELVRGDLTIRFHQQIPAEYFHSLLR